MRSKKVSGKFIFRRVIDTAMTAAIVLLLSSQITGQMAHEWTGITMTVLFVLHTVMNRSWYRNIFRGKYQPVRVMQTVINIALLVCFILTAAGGMLMSQYALTFLRRESFVGTARAMHLAFSHWTYVLVSAHLGIHWGAMMRDVQKKKTLWGVLSAIAVIAAGYGLLLSVRAQIYDYMFFRVEFVFLDYSKAPAQVFLENILMMVSWALISYELARMLRKPSGEDPYRRWICLGMLAAEFAAAAVFSLVVPAAL